MHFTNQTPRASNKLDNNHASQPAKVFIQALTNSCDCGIITSTDYLIRQTVSGTDRICEFATHGASSSDDDCATSSRTTHPSKASQPNHQSPIKPPSASMMPNEQQQQELRAAQNAVILSANPYLSKGMLKPTGFEYNYTEPELSTEERQVELEYYSIENSICERVETAVLRYKMNRKFHQDTLRTFHAFLNFAGFDERPSGFTGGTTKEEAEGLSKEEQARRKQINYMSKEVTQSIEKADGKWVVDFVGVTKGFFSTCFPMQFLFHDDPEHDKKVTNAACNVIRNFFNYLLYHNVCPEYTDQIKAALSAFEPIESEYVKLAAVQSVFPGAFSKACSILTGGYYAKSQYQGNWMDGDVATDSDTGLTAQEAQFITCAAAAAFATPSEDGDLGLDTELEIVKMEEDVGLEVVAITLPAETSKEAQELFSQLKGTCVLPMGKLLCKRYHFQHAAPLDLPPGDTSSSDSFEFIVDEETLRKCYPGLKFIATVKGTNTGFCFIDYWSECYGTFYTWCWNDKAKEYKEGSDRLEPAKPKKRPALGDVVPLGEDRMLEYETPALGEDRMLEYKSCAAEHDLGLEALSIKDAEVPQANGHDTLDAEFERNETNSEIDDEGGVALDADDCKYPLLNSCSNGNGSETDAKSDSVQANVTTD